MTTSSTPPVYPQPAPHTGPRTLRHQDDDIDISKYLILFLENWYWFALALFFSLATAWLINKKVVKVYRVEATLIVNDE